MRRRQLIEIEDLAWCPRTIRDGGTEWLAFLGSVSGAFDAALGPIRRALHATETGVVVDLCSGAGGPLRALAPALTREGVRVVLSDLYPNLEAFATAHRTAGVEFCSESVDATCVPRSLTGVRTMFNAFHHFDAARATAVLADAVAAGQPIAIFEGATTRALGLLVMPMQVPAIFLLTPFVRPFRWSRLLFTYVLPLIPLLVLFDGTVSFLRLYTRPELDAVIAGTPNSERFEWEIGSLRMRGLPAHISYLLGIPKR